MNSITALIATVVVMAAIVFQLLLMPFHFVLKFLDYGICFAANSVTELTVSLIERIRNRMEGGVHHDTES